MNLSPFAWLIHRTAQLELEWKALAKGYLDQPLKKVDAERFDYMLGVVPPILWHKEQGVERFCVSEMQAGSVTLQCAKYKGQYYEKYVDTLDKSTFITPEMIEGFNNG